MDNKSPSSKSSSPLSIKKRWVTVPSYPLTKFSNKKASIHQKNEFEKKPSLPQVQLKKSHKKRKNSKNLKEIDKKPPKGPSKSFVQKPPRNKKSPVVDQNAKELIEKYTRVSQDPRIAKFQQQSPYSQPVRTQSATMIRLESDLINPSQIITQKRFCSPIEMVERSDLTTLNRLRVIEVLEQSSGNNIFKALKQARSQGSFIPIPGINQSKFENVLNSHSYQKLIRFQNLQSELHQKRIGTRICIPPIEFRPQLIKNSDLENFSNQETDRNQLSLTERNNSNHQEPQNLVIENQKRKNFRPFDIESNQSTNRQQETSSEFEQQQLEEQLPFKKTFQASQLKQSLIMLDVMHEYDSDKEESEPFIEEDKASSGIQEWENKFDQELQKSLELSTDHQKVKSTLKDNENKFLQLVSMNEIPKELEILSANQLKEISVESIQDIIDKADTPTRLPKLDLKSISSGRSFKKSSDLTQQFTDYNLKIPAQQVKLHISNPTSPITKNELVTVDSIINTLLYEFELDSFDLKQDVRPFQQLKTRYENVQINQNQIQIEMTNELKQYQKKNQLVAAAQISNALLYEKNKAHVKVKDLISQAQEYYQPTNLISLNFDVDDEQRIKTQISQRFKQIHNIGTLTYKNPIALAVLRRIQYKTDYAGNIIAHDIKLRTPEDQSPMRMSSNENFATSANNQAQVTYAQGLRQMFTFKEKKFSFLNTSVDTLIQNLIDGKSQRRNTEKQVSKAKIWEEHVDDEEFQFRIISEKYLSQIDQFLTSNTYVKAKKLNKVDKLQSVKNLSVFTFGIQRQLTLGGQKQKTKNKEINSIEDAKSLSETVEYIEIRFPITSKEELKKLQKVSNGMLAFLQIKEDMLKDMALLRAPPIIKRTQFLSRSGSGFQSGGSISSVSKLRMHKIARFGTNLNEIREDESYQSDTAEISIFTDWNMQLNKLNKWQKEYFINKKYLQAFQSYHFLQSDLFQLTTVLAEYQESKFHDLNQVYRANLKKQIQNKVFAKLSNHFFRQATTQRTMQFNISDKVNHIFEQSMSPQILSDVIKQIKNQNLIFRKLNSVKLVSSIFYQEDSLLVNCLHYVKEYKSEIVRCFQIIFNFVQQQSANGQIQQKMIEIIKPQDLCFRNHESSSNKFIILGKELLFLCDYELLQFQQNDSIGMDQLLSNFNSHSLVGDVNSKIKNKKDGMAFSSQIEKMMKLVELNEKTQDKGNTMANKLIKVLLNKQMKQSKRRNTVEKLGFIPKNSRYQKITTFMLNQDFGYVTHLKSQGNFMVFVPVSTDSFFQQNQSKLNDEFEQKHFSQVSFTMQRHPSEPKKILEPSPIKEDKEEYFDSDSGQSENQQNKSQGSDQTRKEMSRYQDLKKKFLIRSTTAVTESFDQQGTNLKLVKRKLDYEAISEKTHEGSVRESCLEVLSSQGGNVKKSFLHKTVIDQDSEKQEGQTGNIIAPLRLHIDDESDDEMFYVTELKSSDDQNSIDSIQFSQESDLTPKIGIKMQRNPSSRSDQVTLGSMQNFITKQGTIRKSVSSKIAQQTGPNSQQLHKAEYRDFQNFKFVQEMAENQGIAPNNVIKIVRPKNYVKKVEVQQSKTQNFVNDRFFKGKIIMPYVSQPLKQEPEPKPSDKNKVVQILIGQNDNPKSLLKQINEGSLTISINKAKIDKDRINNKKVIKSIEQNKLKQVQHFLTRNYQGYDIVDKFGNSLLNIACQYGCYEICELLINSGFNVNSQNCQGNTPLHYAISFNHQSLVDLLISNGADEDVKNSKKMTPWQGI